MGGGQREGWGSGTTIVTPSSEKQGWGGPHLMTWLMTIGSGGSRRAVRRWGISENFSRGQSKICSRKKRFPALHSSLRSQKAPQAASSQWGGGGPAWA